MCCLLTVLLFFGPRVTLVVMALFTNYITRAYDTFLLPCLGFIFLPWTTLAYAVAVVNFEGLAGGGLLLVLLGFLFDILSYGGGGYGNRERIRKYY